MIISAGSSSVDISLKKMGTQHTNSTNWRLEDGVKIPKWNSSHSSDLNIKSPTKIPKNPFVKEFPSNNLICEPVPEKGNEDYNQDSSDHLSISKSGMTEDQPKEIQTVSRLPTVSRPINFDSRRFPNSLTSPIKYS